VRAPLPPQTQSFITPEMDDSAGFADDAPIIFTKPQSDPAASAPRCVTRARRWYGAAWLTLHGSGSRPRAPSSLLWRPWVRPPLVRKRCRLCSGGVAIERNLLACTRAAAAERSQRYASRAGLEVQHLSQRVREVREASVLSGGGRRL
jgi:hypothetical protein